jgi:hypothetical protein
MKKIGEIDIPENAAELTTEQVLRIIDYTERNEDAEDFDIEMAALGFTKEESYPDYVRIATQMPQRWMFRAYQQLDKFIAMNRDFELCGVKIEPSTDLFQVSTAESAHRLAEICQEIVTDSEACAVGGTPASPENFTTEEVIEGAKSIEKEIILRFYQRVPELLAVVVCGIKGENLKRVPEYAREIAQTPAMKVLPTTRNFFLHRLVQIAMKVSNCSYPYLLQFNSSQKQSNLGACKKGLYCRLRERSF